MFVKMHFIKGAPAVKGKCVDEQRPAATTAAQGKPEKEVHQQRR